MTAGQAAIAAVVIIGFLSVLAGFAVAVALVIEDLRDRCGGTFHTDAGRSEEPSIEGPPAPIFPLDMHRARRGQGGDAA